MAVFALIASTGAASEVARSVDEKLFATSVEPVLEAAARARGIRLEGLGVYANRTRPAVGDSIVGVVTFLEPHQSRQWLVAMKVGSIDSKVSTTEPLTLYVNSGNAHTFEGALATLAVTTIGPYSASDGARGPRSDALRVRESEASVNSEFLALGFTQACHTVAKLREAREAGLIGEDERFGFGFEPYPAPEVERGRDIVRRAGLTMEDERAFAAVSPALLAYAELISRTPGLREVLFEVIKRPSLWSILVRVGRIETGLLFHGKSVTSVDPGTVEMPAWMEIHHLAFTLSVNDTPALECSLLVAPPRPPFLTTAGIVGMTARRPGDDSRRLAIRLVAAQAAAGEND